MIWHDEPVVGQDAFTHQGDSQAASSVAAYLLRVSGRMIGDEDALIPSESFPTPDVEYAEPASLQLEELLNRVNIDLETHEAGVRDPALATDVGANIGVELFSGDSSAVAVGALVEAELHSEHEVIRVAAAVASLDTTGPRENTETILVEGLASEDVDVADMAAVGLARINRNHDALQRLVGPAPQQDGLDEEHETLVMTHGTWASGRAWYRPGGDFHDYVGLNHPALWAPSFQWTGDYNHNQRLTDATALIAWLDAGAFDAPDFMAHSHGVTVANLATHSGQQFNKMFFLSWPVHQQWLPRPQNVGEIVDVRVRMDLVIMADRGGQRIRNAGFNFTEERHGWFAHSASHDPDYWAQHNLTRHLP